jgi:basic membrane lipoprotein Med (substrate-binding protein (PBP1-ABC) superfamily)
MKARRSRPLLAALVCALFTIVLLFPSCSEPESGYRVALIGFEEGEQDEERNTLAEYGQRRAEAELGVEVDFIVPGPGEDLEDLFSEGEYAYDLVISLGQDSSLDMLFARPEATDVQTAALDFEISQPVPGEDEAALVRYRVEEGSYICGYLAGWLSGRTDHPFTNPTPLAAFIGALDDPMVVYYNSGFTKGVQAGDPEGGTHSYFLESAKDSQQAKAYAEEAIEKGVDIFFCSPGPFNEEVIEVVEKEDALVILVGADRSQESPEHVLTSLILRDDNAVFAAVQAALDGDLDPGRQAWGIGEGTWSIAPFHGNDPYIRKELKEALRQQEGKVRSIDFSS